MGECKTRPLAISTPPFLVSALLGVSNELI